MRRFQLAAVAAAVTAVVAAVAFLPHPAEGATATANLTVQAAVPARCTIAANTLNFGNYDPNGAANITSTGTVTLTCTRNTPYSVVLTSANNFRMNDGGTNNLAYTLYQPNNTTVWDGTHAVAGSAPSRNAIPLTVNGVLAPGQDVPTGNYSDSVVATVTF
jgi:spore coat protein U-like protein